jgi:hypothetical protein
LYNFLGQVVRTPGHTSRTGFWESDIAIRIRSEALAALGAAKGVLMARMLGALPGRRGIDRHPAHRIAGLARHPGGMIVTGSRRREWFHSRQRRLSL